MKENERERKKLKAVEITKLRDKVPEEAEKYREKERVKKCKQQHANEIVKEMGIEKLKTPMKRKIKTLKQTEKDCTLAMPSGGTCHQSRSMDDLTSCYQFLSIENLPNNPF